ncbi:MAG: glycosyltransferase [Acidimicrobiia bacterium]|nr:glycosyltransferase [Acidimicrobiia bacterium]
MGAGRKLVFVTSELEPANTGGGAALIDQLARRLADEGREVVVLLVGAADVPPAPYQVIRVDPGMPDREAPLPFLAHSRTAATALTELDPAAVASVEFHDYGALGFWALSRRAELGLGNVPLAVRFHGPFDMLLDSIAADPPQLRTTRMAEGICFRMADRVVAPSPQMALTVARRYDVDPDRIAVSPPLVPSTDPVARRPSPDPEFVFFGRLDEVKGPEVFVEAALDLAATTSDARFRIIGDDGWSFTHEEMMLGRLHKMIPQHLAGRFSFEPRLERSAVPDALASAWAVVIPSRFESFCLAAHEVRRMGVPLVLSEIEAFDGYFTEQSGARRFDGSAAGLASLLAEMSAERSGVDVLAAAPPPQVEDGLSAYRAPVAVRHPRSQAGLGTVAVSAIESSLRDETQPSGEATWANRLLRAMPEPIARLAVKILPASIKNRFRRQASWPAEVERRQAARRRTAFEEKAAQADPNIAPDVSVVIPCFNQGQYLDDAIMSVFEQDHDGFEVIVVDDGSTDQVTIDIIDQLELPRVRVIRQDNAGLSAARNAGMSAARGRYLVPLDADDELKPTYLSRLLSEISEDPSIGFVHCWAEFFGDVEGVYATRAFNEYQLLMSNSVVGCAMIRREAFEQVGGYDETMGQGNEDWDLWVRLTASGWGQRVVPEALFRYRRHGASMSAHTEARFESARREMAQRHPGLYAPGRLKELKRANYPLVSIVVADVADVGELGDQTVEDAEVVPIGPPGPLIELCDRRGWNLREEAESASAAAEAARGKYILDWRAVGQAGDDFVIDAARALESSPKTRAVALSGQPVMWRARAIREAGWEDAPDHAMAGSASGEGSVKAAILAPDRSPSGVIHQDPDVEGFIPDWSSSG